MARVILVSAVGGIGGAEKSLLLLAAYLRKWHTIGAACPVDGPLWGELGRLGCRCYALPGCDHKRPSLVSFVVWWVCGSVRLWTVVRQFGAEIIHANTMHAALVTPLATVATGCGLVYHARDFSRKSLVAGVLGYLADRVIAISQAIRRDLLNHGINPVKISVVHNGVAERGQSAEGGAERDIAAVGPITFANIGQFVWWKNHELFVAAAAEAAKHLPSARFWLVGDDGFRMNVRYRAELAACVRRHALEDRLTFVEWCDEMDRIWAEVSCLVHTAEREPFGRVIIEAMAAGVPVIAVDSCGPSEIIRHERTGLLVRPRDIGAVAGAMLRIARDRSFAAALAQAAREMVYSRFRAEDTAMRVAQVYEQVLAN